MEVDEFWLPKPEKKHIRENVRKMTIIFSYLSEDYSDTTLLVDLKFHGKENKLAIEQQNSSLYQKRKYSALYNLILSTSVTVNKCMHQYIIVCKCKMYFGCYFLEYCAQPPSIISGQLTPHSLVSNSKCS